MEKSAKMRGGNKDKALARVAIHEGVGHEFAGSGHSNGSYSSDGNYIYAADRYNGTGYDEKHNIISNIMNTGDENSYDSDSFKFLPSDLNKIKSRIPDQGKEYYNLYQSSDTNCPNDNFSNR